MNNDLMKIANLVIAGLSINCPVLSGNMKSHIEVVSSSNNEITICISAPFYDLKEWKKSGNIVYVGNKGEFSDYAYWVNQLGAFGRKNKSQYWVNRSLYSSVNAVANEIGAIVLNKLPIS